MSPPLLIAYHAARHFRRCRILCVALILGCVYRAQSQQIDPNLATLIREEKAFAAKAEETDVPTAFLAYLDSAAVIFNGEGAVSGIAQYSKVPKGKGPFEMVSDHRPRFPGRRHGLYLGPFSIFG